MRYSLSWRFIRMWQRNRDVLFRLWYAELPPYLGEPVIILLSMGLGLGAYIGLVGGQRYIEFIVPGVIASYSMFSATFECTYGTFTRMEYQKTYDAIIATPLSVEDVIAGEIFWGATRSLMTSIIILAIAAAFQLVHSPWALLVPVLSFLHGIMFSAIAVTFTSIVPSIYSFGYFFSLFITPMFYLSGVFFPLSAFPRLIQNLSWLSPLTPVVYLTRELVSGVFTPQALWAVAIIIGLSAVFFALSLITMRRRIIV